MRFTPTSRVRVFPPISPRLPPIHPHNGINAGKGCGRCHVRMLFRLTRTFRCGNAFGNVLHVLLTRGQLPAYRDPLLDLDQSQLLGILRNESQGGVDSAERKIAQFSGNVPSALYLLTFYRGFQLNLQVSVNFRENR